MRISIAMATYNGARFINEQLRSIQEQTVPPYELVISDDGSSDATIDIVSRFAVGAPFPVRIFRNERNMGWRENFLRAALLCSGDWVAFADQDDVWLPRKLQRVAEVAALPSDVVMVIHSADVVDENLVATGERTPDFPRFRVAAPLASPPWLGAWGFTCCFDRSILHEIDVAARPRARSDVRNLQAHDEFIFMLANVLGRVGYVSESLALYRRHQNAVTADCEKVRDVIPGLSAMSSVSLESLSDVTVEYASFFRSLEGRLAGIRAERCRSAAAYFSVLGNLLMQRSLLYRPHSTWPTRAMHLVRLIATGTYRGYSKGLGHRALLKDVAATALHPLQHVLRRGGVAGSRG
jgi:glycosyltransferase involved in cell wall biosynthesis